MVQLSKYKLDKALEEEMFRQFWSSLSALRNASTVSSFFSDLLTTTEEMMLAKRFTVAVLLLRGKRPVDIKRTLHVTDTSICSVSSWLKNVKPQTSQIIQRIIKESDWQKFSIDLKNYSINYIRRIIQIGYRQGKINGNEKWSDPRVNRFDNTSCARYMYNSLI